MIVRITSKSAVFAGMMFLFLSYLATDALTAYVEKGLWSWSFWFHALLALSLVWDYFMHWRKAIV